MKTKILRNIFLSVGVIFASARLLSAGMNDGVLNFSNTPLVHPQATFITFDAPGGQHDLQPSAINPAGAITGSYITGSSPNFTFHGFLRAPDGTFATIDPPGSTLTEIFGGINPAGTIAGTYFDASGAHGFLRAPDGTFTTFDPPGSTFTGPFGINPAGVIAGFYFDANFVEHGFLRAPDGTMTTYNHHVRCPGCRQRHTTRRHQPGWRHRRILF
jgi:hypothetical protein